MIHKLVNESSVDIVMVILVIAESFDRRCDMGTG